MSDLTKRLRVACSHQVNGEPARCPDCADERHEAADEIERLRAAIAREVLRIDAGCDNLRAALAESSAARELWACGQVSDSGEVNVWPAFGRKHDDGVGCWCGPERDQEPRVILHRIEQ